LYLARGLVIASGLVNTAHEFRPFMTSRTHRSRFGIAKADLGARRARGVFPVLLGVCVVWSLWPVLAGMVERWSNDPRYAHGYLVPVFAVALLWMRRHWLCGPSQEESTWGLAFLGLGAALQLVGGYYRLQPIEGYALLPYLAGLSLLAGGWRNLSWAWPSIVFLAFMIPLPWRVENALGVPLQSVASSVSTYVLQTFGFMAFAEGNVIQLNEARIGIAEACSGLSMVMTFIALATAAALVVKRPLSDKIVLVASSVPVAMAANIARIVLTAVLHDRVSDHAAWAFYHDVAGWVMIPLALILYWFEIWILSKLLLETVWEAPSPLSLGGSNRPGPAVTVSTERFV
jgi:exosortase